MRRADSTRPATRRKVLVSKFIFVLIVIFLALLILVYLGRVAKNLDYFWIKEVLIRGASHTDLSYLKGQNIFTLDIFKESDYILQISPDYKKVRLVKILPNRLFVDFIPRKPMAYVKLYRIFCVDEEAALFNLTPQLEEPDLPVICGLETKIFGPQSGRKYNVKELNLSLNIIDEIKRDKLLKAYTLRKIDVQNPAHTSFFITLPRGGIDKQGKGFSIEADSLEIKIGQENIKDRITILGNLLLQLKDRLKNIKYIDLRFKEPVIKLK